MIDEDSIATVQQMANQRGELSIWTIYDHPTDFPEGFIARRFAVGPDPQSPTATKDIAIGTLEELRQAFDNNGLVCLTKHETDDPKIVEVWL